MGRKSEAIVEGVSRMLVILAHGFTDAYLDSVHKKQIQDRKSRVKK